MAERSNITLSSLEEMNESIREELERYTLSSLEKKAALVAEGLQSLYAHESTTKSGYSMGTSRLKTGVDGKAVTTAGSKLSVLEWGFRTIRIGKRVIPIRFEEDGNTLRGTDEVGRFLEAASKIVSEAEAVLREESGKAEENA